MRDELPIALFVSLILYQFLIPFDDRFFSSAVQDRHLMFLFIGNHVFHSMHPLFKQFRHLRVDFIDLIAQQIDPAGVSSMLMLSPWLLLYTIFPLISAWIEIFFRNESLL